MTIPGIHVQARDVALWQEMDEVGGIFDTAMARARHWPTAGTDEACLRRLRLYAAHGITRIIQLSVCIGNCRGRPATVHCLAPRGGDLVAEVTGTPPRHIHKRDPKPETIQHRLGVARMQLAVKDACAVTQLPKPAFILEQDIHPGVAPGAPLSQRFILFESWTAPDGKQVSCRPDASSWLRIPAQGDTKSADLLVYWEYDRSTQVLARIARRVEGYRLLHTSGAFRTHWPHAVNPTVRVFFVAQSEERLQNVAAVIRDLSGAELFRLTTVAALQPRRLLVEPIWKTAHGESRPILRRPLSFPAA